jgi:hypothetical protein
MNTVWSFISMIGVVKNQFIHVRHVSCSQRAAENGLLTPCPNTVNTTTDQKL